ncbi:BRO-N domain-containing protein, partial [Pseudomonas tremae]
YTPTPFHRHNRQLLALLLENQPWFSARDLGRMIGWPLNERTLRKLDADQHRMITLDLHGEAQPELMVSESGTYAMMVHHYHAENRGLRQWPGLSVSMLHWHSEPWIRLRDMPRVLAHPQMQVEARPHRLAKSWWRAVLPVSRLGCSRLG